MASKNCSKFPQAASSHRIWLAAARKGVLMGVCRSWGGIRASPSRGWCFNPHPPVCFTFSLKPWNGEAECSGYDRLLCQVLPSARLWFYSSTLAARLQVFINSIIVLWKTRLPSGNLTGKLRGTNPRVFHWQSFRESFILLIEKSFWWQTDLFPS